MITYVSKPPVDPPFNYIYDANHPHPPFEDGDFICVTRADGWRNFIYFNGYAILTGLDDGGYSIHCNISNERYGLTGLVKITHGDLILHPYKEYGDLYSQFQSWDEYIYSLYGEENME